MRNRILPFVLSRVFHFPAIPSIFRKMATIAMKKVYSPERIIRYVR